MYNSSYSTFSPLDDRFGFKTNGTFKCAYDSERVVVLLFFALILLFIVGGCICAVVGVGMLNTPVDIESAISAADQAERNFFGFDTRVYGVFIISMVIFFIMAVLSAAALLMAVAVLKSGIPYSFRADENRMEIIKQGKHRKIIVINYDDVINVDFRERKFIFLGGLDVWVCTKNKVYEFRYIHSRLSRVCGLSETPFNIICERAGLVSRPR